jgi:hypothetical protein
MKTRVMDLPGWPPQPGGAFKGGDTFPQSTDQVTVDKYLNLVRNHVSFTCIWNGKPVGYDFTVPDEATGKKVQKILEANLGKKLFDIGFIEIPE